MKKINYLIIGMVALSTAFTSCSSSEDAEGNAAGAKVHATLSATLPGDNGTRVELTEGLPTVNKVKVAWSTVDNIQVVDNGAGNSTANFTTTTDGQSATANFSGDLLSLAEGHMLYAYYPTSMALTGTKAAVDYASQSGTLDALKNTAPMYASAAYSASGTNLAFQNATTILRVNVVLPLDASIKTVKLSGTGLVNKESFTPASDNTATWSDPTTGDVTATFANGLAATKNNAVVVYLGVIPQTLTSGFTVTATIADGRSYEYKYAGSAIFEASKAVNINNSKSAFSQVVSPGDFIYPDGNFGPASYGTATGQTASAIIFSNETSAKDKAAGYTRGYALALNNAASNVAWATTSASYNNTDAPGLQNNNTFALWSGDQDGRTETETIKGYGIDNYPAAKAAVTYNVPVPTGASGWYLPSSGQWYQIITNLGGISTSTVPTNWSTVSGNDAGTYGEAWLYYGKSASAADALNSAMSAVGKGNFTPISNTENTYGNWFWCSSEFSATCACGAYFYYDGSLYLCRFIKTNTDAHLRVRAALAF